MLLQAQFRSPSVVSRSGDKPMLERRVADVSNGTDVGEWIVASSKEAPAMRVSENITRNIQPLLSPKPWRIHKNVLHRQAGV